MQPIKLILITCLLLAFSAVGKTDEVLTIDYYENGLTLKSITTKHAVNKEETSLNFKRNGELLTANTTNFKTSKHLGLTFFLVKSLEANAPDLKIINFTLNNNLFEQLYLRFLTVKIAQENDLLQKNTTNLSTKNPKNVQNKQEPISVPVKNQLLAPQVVKPKVASGLKFLPNGRNKLYTQAGDIWMDGEFKKGQLMDGKVFLYDSDGVLLKVRIYKNGAYERDGLL
ncbi:MAG: hypothetical protein ACEQR5_09755 [Moraxellaceae bacterium]|jgi:hypothetical protein